MKPQGIRLAELREHIIATRDLAELEAIAIECERRRSAAAAETARMARLRARALKAHMTRRSMGALPHRRPGRAALSLVSWLVANGGLRDAGGEVLALLGGRHQTRPGLIRRFGRPLDLAALAAREEGYFPEHRLREGSGVGTVREAWGGGCSMVDTMSPAALLEAIGEELAGRCRRYPEGHEPEPPALDPGALAHAEDEARREESDLWRELMRITQDDGWTAAWHFMRDRGRLVDEEVPF